MPLTIVHPVAVLPFRKCGLPLSAMIVGAMSPDLEYLYHLAPRGRIGHTPLGLIVFCVPVGLAVLWLFHRVWKQPLLDLFAGERSGDREHFAFLPLGRLALLAAAILFGAVTHVTWDSFTHRGGWMVQNVPVLSAAVVQTEWFTLRVYKIFQHGSTLLGFGIFGFIAWCHRARLARVPKRSWALLAGAFVLGGLAGLGIAALREGLPENATAAARLFGIGIVSGAAVFLAEVTLYAIAWHTGVLNRLRAQESPRA
ncbi:MAG: DUF4184 family protein [Candidatus Sumerlaeia bacterium]|nr:DUF4184 family protein [Candidatus Sumerlaeia bacterium]